MTNTIPPDLQDILTLVLAHVERIGLDAPAHTPDEIADGARVAAAVRQAGHPLSDGAGTTLWGMWCLDQHAGWIVPEPGSIMHTVIALCESIRDGFGPYIVVGEGATRCIGDNPRY